jgi:hypothetical protein
MAFNCYITFDEYIALGGRQVPEDEFARWERKARRQLDYYTFNRVQSLTRIPAEVKEVLVEYIDKMYSKDVSGGSYSSASTYSNGVESFTFSENASSQFSNELCKVAIDWLPTWLTARSVNFNVENYLQSESNNS